MNLFFFREIANSLGHRGVTHPFGTWNTNGPTSFNQCFRSNHTFINAPVLKEVLIYCASIVKHRELHLKNQRSLQLCSESRLFFFTTYGQRPLFGDNYSTQKKFKSIRGSGTCVCFTPTSENFEFQVNTKRSFLLA